MLNSSTPVELITTAELAGRTAGGINYIRTKGNEVKGLAITRKRNPSAPKAPGEPGQIVFGRGKRRKASAYLFLRSDVGVPVFMKRGTNVWEYFGEYRAVKISTEEETIREHCGNRPFNGLAGVLFIESIHRLNSR